MAGTEEKKKSSVTLFFAAFVVIAIIMFIANHKSSLENEIHLPFNNGIINLTSFKNFLIAVSLDEKIYILDWNNLSKEPQTGSVKSIQTAMLKENFIISLQKNPKSIVATNLKGDKKLKKIPLGTDKTPSLLGLNSSGNTIAVLLTKIQQPQEKNYYELRIVDFDHEITKQIINESTDATKISALAISNNGELAAITGENNGLGWITVINITKKQKVWEKTLPDSGLLWSIAFSRDDKSIFAGGDDNTLYIIDKNGAITAQLRPPGAKKKNNTPVTNITISPDGRLLAANFRHPFNVWKIANGKHVFSKHPDHKITSGVAFSPDSKYIATSDLRQGGTIKVWNLPQN